MIDPSKGPLTVVPRSLELKRHLERQVFLLDGPNVDMTDSAWVRDDGFEVDSVDEGFLERNVLDA